VRAGSPSEALEEGERAAAILTASAGADGLPMARCLDTQAAALVALGRAPAAENACRRALAIRLGRLSDDEPELAESLVRLADVLDAGGGASESVDLARAAGLGGVRELGAHLRRIAANLGAMDPADGAPGSPEPGQADPGDAALNDLLALKRVMLGDRARGVGQTLAGMGWRLLDAGRNESAERPLREAIAILEEQYGPDDLAVANCLERLADTLIRQYRFAESVEVYERELRIWRRQPGAALEGVNVALCQRELARNMTWAGRYDEAIANFREAIAGFAANCGPMHHSRGLAMSQCALALLGAGRIDEAEAMARQGREIALKHPSLPDDQRMQVDAALGLVLMARDRADEAEPLLLAAEAYCVKYNWLRDAPRQPDLIAIEQALGRIRDQRAHRDGPGGSGG
jgi:tetratricopeptide (TPR) repeat protein